VVVERRGEWQRVWDAGSQQFIDKSNHGPVFFDPNFAIDNPQQDRFRA